MANLTQTVPYDFDELFDEARKILYEGGFDVSDGSNTTQLAALMAYFINALNVNTSTNINETLLPYATVRRNVLQDARVLGYEARHITSYQYRITMQLTIPDDIHTEFDNLSNGKKLKYTVIDPDTNAYVPFKIFHINRYDYFTAGSKAYYYFGEPIAVSVYYDPSNNNLTLSQSTIELTFKEGELITYEDDVASLEQTIGSVTVNGTSIVRNYIDIPYTNVEENGIECFVTYYDEAGNLQQSVEFYKSNDSFLEKETLEDGSFKHKFLRQDDLDMETPRIYFKYAGCGEGIPYGSLVQLNILISSGLNGAFDGEVGSVSFAGIELEKFITVTNVEMVSNATNPESIQSIKENAPRVYNSAHRLVTAIDYESACKRNEHVKDASVWGGEDEFPKCPGHIWFSFYPEKTDKRILVDVDGNSSHYHYNNADTGTYNYLFKIKEDGLWNLYGIKRTINGNSVTYKHLSDNTNASQAEITKIQTVIDNLKEKAERDNKQLKKAYNNNYILDSEIKYENKFYNESTGKVNIHYSGVWGDIDKQRIPSLIFHHRHPIYINFDYEFDILKYNKNTDISVIHSTLFNCLDNCFTGNDETYYLERFESEYFHTNIIKRVDFQISDLYGFNTDLKTYLVLNEKTCSVEQWDNMYKDIYIPLALPYETIFDNGYLDISRVPSIDTDDFITYDISEVDEQDAFERTSLSDDESYLINKNTVNLLKIGIFTDWDQIKTDTFNDNTTDNDSGNLDTTTHEDRLALVAPVRAKIERTMDAPFPSAMEVKQISGLDKVYDDYYIFELGTSVVEDGWYRNEDENLYKRFSLIKIKNVKLKKTGNKYEIQSETNYEYCDCGFNCDHQIDTDDFWQNIAFYKDVKTVTHTHETGIAQVQAELYYDDVDYVTYKLGVRKSWYDSKIKHSDLDLDVIKISYTQLCGWYYIFNGFKKEILIHLFVSGYDEGFSRALEGFSKNKEGKRQLEEFSDTWATDEVDITEVTKYIDRTYTTPASYLYSKDDRYFKTYENASDPLTFKKITNNIYDVMFSDGSSLDYRYYLTFDGYLIDPNNKEEFINDVYTEQLIRAFDPCMYLNSPFTFDMFKVDRYLKLKYPSDNFRVIKNVIPRLHDVIFKNASKIH